MADQEYESTLLKVLESDLLAAMVEEITDPTHANRFNQFRHTNPKLAHEVIKLAYQRARTAVDNNYDTPDIHKTIIDTVTYVLHVLEITNARKAAEDAFIDDDVDGEDQPLSA